MHDLRRPTRRILLVSYYFPPNVASAAVRTGKMARYFIENGWDIRVLTARKEGSATLPLEVDPNIVTQTEWYDVDRALSSIMPARINRMRGRLRDHTDGPARDTMWRRLLRAARPHLVKLESTILRWPDRHIGWRRPAMRAAEAILADWRPNLIYASAPPATSLLIADDLSRRHGIPWVAELRDLWVDFPYYPYGPIRRSFERLWETRVLGRAAAMVTVSSKWQEMLERRFDKPVALVMNGYDPNDLPTSPASRPNAADPLRILHTGHIYSGFRDPTPLFEAIRSLGPNRSGVIAEFVGTNVEVITELARRAGVEDRVVVRPSIAYRDSLALQANADVLLHLQWNHPKDAGTIGGKLFEYIGARRPILCIGYDSGSVAQIVGDRKAGLVSNDPNVIADQLRDWIGAKKSGGVPPLPDSAAAGLTRTAQFSRLLHFLDNLACMRTSNTPRSRATASDESFGFKRTRHFKFAETSGIDRPLLVVTIDTEEEFDWSKPFSRLNRGVDALRGLHEAHAIFRKWVITPTYVVDYPIVESALGRELIGHWLNAGECDVGAHLHPWVNPPDEEEVGKQNSYPGNLPAELERAKLAALTEQIHRRFGRPPLIYRAGRYGLGPHSPAILEDLGYMVDLSVVPFTSFSAEQGPDFTEFGNEPFWFGNRRRLLELPLTRGFVGLMRNARIERFDWLNHGIRGRLRLAGALSRSGLLERITLTPEGNSLDDLRRLCRSLAAARQRIFVFSFHSPSLVPGNTHYVRSDRDVVGFLARIDGFFAFFRDELGGEFTSPMRIYEMLDGALVTGRV